MSFLTFFFFYLFSSYSFPSLIISFYTGSSSLSAGTNDGNVYSTQGTNDQIANAIAKAINNISKIINRDLNSFGEEIVFEAVSQGPKVIVYYKNASEIFNNVEFSIFANVAYVENLLSISGSNFSVARISPIVPS